MNIVGVTQGANLRVFLRLVDMLQEPLALNTVSAFVADSLIFKRLAAREVRLKGESVFLLKEWEITAQGQTRMPDWQRIAEWEKSLGDPVFWNALMADRRIYFGARCKMRQDYRPRFTHEELGGILQTALERIDAFLDRVQPDLVLGFGTATLGDYLFCRFAKVRGIPYLQLKATKIGNYVSLNDDLTGLSQHIADIYKADGVIDTWALEEAKAHLGRTRRRGLSYEGALRRGTRLQLGLGVQLLGRGLLADARRCLDRDTRTDNQLDSLTLTHLYARFLNPLKGAFIKRRLRHRFITQDQLPQQRPFVFYPLHFEPEVSMQVFGRPFQNQIELIRTLAMALPANMLLLVKEHPRAVGFRPRSYYRKLLDIPNVRLVDIDASTFTIIRHSRMVAVISGSTGLEAAICGKPVLTFGVPPYNALPSGMVRHVGSLHELSNQVRSLMQNYLPDEAALERFVGAMITGSVGVDLYTVLLEKKGRIGDPQGGKSVHERRKEDYDRLADYCHSRIVSVSSAKKIVRRAV